jgi:predicted ATP-binding protein involved in virulence
MREIRSSGSVRERGGNKPLYSESNPTASGITLDLTPITIFVGPNNSGKSQVLREINDFCQSGQKNHTFVIVDDVTFETLTSEQVTSEIRQHILEPNQGERIHEGQIL